MTLGETVIFDIFPTAVSLLGTENWGISHSVEYPGEFLIKKIDVAARKIGCQEIDRIKSANKRPESKVASEGK